MEHIMGGLRSDEDARPRESAADWLHSVQFDGITYMAKGGWGGHIITEGERALTIEDLGPELYRVAFRIDGYGGYSHQDGNATYLNPARRFTKSRAIRRSSGSRRWRKVR